MSKGGPSETQKVKAAKKLVLANIPLAKSLVNRMWKSLHLRALLGSKDDAHQVAYLALSRAASEWTPRRGKFSTIAYLAIWRDLVKSAQKGTTINIAPDTSIEAAELSSTGRENEMTEDHHRAQAALVTKQLSDSPEHNLSYEPNLDMEIDLRWAIDSLDEPRQSIVKEFLGIGQIRAIPLWKIARGRGEKHGVTKLLLDSALAELREKLKDYEPSL